MRALILAGGFAKRMGEIAEGTPKCLLPVAGRPVIEHILKKIEALPGIGEVSVSTNKKFEDHFSEWSRQARTPLKVSLVIEPAMEEGQKLGSIGALRHFLERARVNEDLLVVNGDNLFEFDLKRLLEFYSEKKTFSFGVYDTRSIEEARKMGVVLADHNGEVLNFEEKPAKPKSTTVSTGIYAFPASTLPLVGMYLEEGNSPDRMGDLLIWLMKRQKLHAFIFRDRWFDIGTPDTYMKAQQEFGK